ncbi:hypothetical protein L596_006194 [Steinernema carpocapsae]|uniref:Uncharacterized protein n=1 Tax=Steinernema carpocapsae TaxID=34508 RepID=A0A4U8V1F9_STECR|nr:hypothetical protein L596_006194 [Steinernema carpocapsae]
MCLDIMRCLLCTNLFEEKDLRLHIEGHLAHATKGSYKCKNITCAFFSYHEETMVSHVEQENHEGYEKPSEEDLKTFFYGRHLVKVIEKDTKSVENFSMEELLKNVHDRKGWSVANLKAVNCLICAEQVQSEAFPQHLANHLKFKCKQIFFRCDVCGCHIHTERGVVHHFKKTGHIADLVRNEYYSVLRMMISSDTAYVAFNIDYLTDPDVMFNGSLYRPQLIPDFYDMSADSESGDDEHRGIEVVANSIPSSPEHSNEDTVGFVEPRL